MRTKALVVGLSLLLASLLLVGACTQAHVRPEGLRPPPPEPTPEQTKSGGASISVDKMVSIDGGATWVEQVNQYVCQNVEFQIIVNNDGDVPLSNIVISDYLPDCLEYVDGPAVGGICKTQVPYSPYYNLPGTSTPTWRCSELAPGNSAQVIYTAHVVESGMCKNQVSVEGEYDGESVIEWGSATVTGITEQPPILADWGDAPHPYPTLSLEDGAYHPSNGPWLGSARDEEPDGQPDVSALGDDNNGNDDEDGVTGLTGVTTGQPHNFTIVVSGGGGYVRAWIDWNSDGDWTHLTEQTFNGYFSDGTHTINVAVPTNAVVGQTFARFRISSDWGFFPTGAANDGEVEDYEIRIEEGQSPILADWGDAPDQYPTLNANNGAYHLPNGPWLGSARDEEPDGQPDASALGDDNNGNDDEDGITGLTGVITGQTSTFTVVVSGGFGGGYVQTWVDWNSDSVWQHPAEQIFNNHLSDGTHTITVAVPSNAVVGQTFARFRISLKGGLLPTGGWGNGEVEDYAIVIEEEQPPGWADWGDAPHPYPTLSLEDGAYHLPNGPWLGSTRDVEPDGQPDTSALGDDNDGNDDEDGVTGLTGVITGQTSTFTIVVSGGFGGGYVYAWVDWNSDGVWQHPAEQIFDNYLSDGTHTITVAVPSNAVVGQTFARFRILTYSKLSPPPTGGSGNGEVEDYKLYISD